MLAVYPEIILKISEELTDHEKINFSMITKQMDKFKHKFKYGEKISISKITNLSYFDNFENIVILSHTITKYPAHTKYVHFETKYPNIPPSVTHLSFYKFDRPIINCIPSSVIYLDFGSHFDRSIKDCIPPSVTHLVLGVLFTQSIEDCIPSSVTHLVINNCDRLQKKDRVPSSVTHLTLCHIFLTMKDNIPSSVTHLTINHGYANCIPLSVTHLTFGPSFYQPINDGIPSSITHLIFGRDFNRSIEGIIPASVTHLTFDLYFDQEINELSSSIKELTLHKNYSKLISEHIASRINIKFVQ